MRCNSEPVSLQHIENEVAEQYRMCEAALRRYVEIHGARPSQAEDFVQDAFLRYFLARMDQQQIENPRAWLFTVVRNRWLETVRSAAQSREVDLVHAQGLAEWPVDVSQAALWPLALNLLAPRERECLELRRDGLQYDEIAQAMGIRPGTVAALIARAQVKIRRGLPVAV